MELKWLWLRSLPKKAFVWRGRPDFRRIALSFDDGPDEDITDELLRILKGYNIIATFFLSGYQMAKHPDLLTKIYHDGHEIGSHAYEHRALSSLTFNEIVKELTLTQEFVRQQVGYQIKLFRPPYGDLNFKVIRAALKCNLTTVLWTVDPKDYSFDNPLQVIGKLRETEFRGGEIVLLHNTCHATLKALPDIIRDFSVQGIQMTNISGVI